VKKREMREDRVLKAMIRQMYEAGYSVSKIAKELGHSYPHVKRIVEYIRQEQS